MVEAEHDLWGDPSWYKDAIIYQVHVKGFRDTTGNGMGDFRGLIEKLDYLKDLGITALWLLPFYPSPMKDDGYDIADYFRVNPEYGTLKDFKTFLREAHRRGIRIITEIVLNHTSDQHPWFQRARKAPPESRWRNFYVWSDTPDKYSEARIIFKDFETSNWSWDPVARAYYWHRFYSHQPDLNYESQDVQKLMFRACDFWLKMGVDGLRFDAVPYLYEREGTNCENLPETYDFLRRLRAHVDERCQGKMLLAEANQWPEDAVAYFGDGDICHTAFHFPLMPRLYIALQMEDSFPIIDIIDQTPPIPDICQWVIFLRNHDELTLEMVTDEERDYMYRVYARDPKARLNLGIRRRLAPLVSNNRKIIELLNIMLFSLPGTPVIYYGDEIGMGDNYYLGDRNGVRTPMQWSPGKNAGFSDANPQKLYLPVIIDPEYHYEAVNVETQQANPASLLWWMKRIISTRKRFRAFGRGKLEFLHSSNPRVLAFIREYEDEVLLTVVNLSRFSQSVELNLSDYMGITPLEIFSLNRFPVIRDISYPLTLGSYGYYWFLLKKEEKREGIRLGEKLIQLNCRTNWRNFPDEDTMEKLEEDILPAYLSRSRWFGGKSLIIQRVNVYDKVPLQIDGKFTHLFLLDVTHTDGSTSRYLLPLSFAQHDEALRISRELECASLATLILEKEGEGLLFDSVYDENFSLMLLKMISQKKKVKGRRGVVSAYPSKKFKELYNNKDISLKPHFFGVEQSNSSVTFDEMLFLKLYRKLEEGENPEIEMVQFLTERAGFTNIPSFQGMMQYQESLAESTYICLLQSYVPNQGDAWLYTLKTLGSSFERILAEKPVCPCAKEEYTPDFISSFEDIPVPLIDYAGPFFMEMIQLLGRRTGEMHRALVSYSKDPDFTPEQFTTLYQRALYQSLRSQTRRTIQFLKQNISKLSPWLVENAKKVIDLEGEILKKQTTIISRKISGMKIRTHGDYHLGQVLFTGKDFVIIDFEGEPGRAMSERRIKRSPLRDVAGMIRSLHYAVYTSEKNYTVSRPEDEEILKPWSKLWFQYTAGLFLFEYLNSVKDLRILPSEKKEIRILLESFLIEKCLYEIVYELNSRPDWVDIPIKGILSILEKEIYLK